MCFKFNGVAFDVTKPIYLYCYTYDNGNHPIWFPFTASEIGKYTLRNSARKFWVTELRFEKGTDEVVSVAVEDCNNREYVLRPNQGNFISTSAVGCKKLFNNHIASMRR